MSKKIKNKILEKIKNNLENGINDSKSIKSHLKKIGRLDINIDAKVLLVLLEHKNQSVRLEAVKHLGKLKGKLIENSLIKLFNNDNSSIVKRECVSSLGRQRNEKNINFFISILNERDPKIVLQSIRSLLVFKSDKKVAAALRRIKKHPNEMIKEILEMELDKKIVKSKEKHSYVDPRLKNVVVNGDAIEVLKLIKEESFHLTFTSPPYYNARDYSFYLSYKEYLNFLRVVFKETYRLTKNGRFLIVNTSPIIIPRVSRKHSSKRYPIPFDIHSFLVKDGWEFIDDIIWKKPDSSVKNRVGGFLQHRKPLAYKPNNVTEYLMVYRKKSYDLIDWNIKQYDNSIIDKSKVNDNFEMTNVWNIDSVYDKNHSAVFPEKLCDRVIKYYSYVGDLVFDPFAGSGTFGKVAIENGRNFFLTEIDKMYCGVIERKLGALKDKKLKFLDYKKFKEDI